MSTRYMLSTLTILTLIGGPALAQSTQGDVEAPRKAAVSYAHLNLNTETGQAILVLGARDTHRHTALQPGHHPILPGLSIRGLRAFLLAGGYT